MQRGTKDHATCWEANNSDRRVQMLVLADERKRQSKRHGMVFILRQALQCTLRAKDVQVAYIAVTIRNDNM